MLGTMLVAIVALALRLRPTSSASTRALVWAVTVLAVPGIGAVLLAGIDFGAHAHFPTRWARPASALGQVFGPGLGPGFGSGFASGGDAGDGSGAALPAWLWRIAPAVTSTVLWSWVLLAMLRLVGLGAGLVTLVRWRARCRPLDPTAWQRLPAWTCLRDTGRRAGVVISPDVASPCVLGLWRPCIALPPSALTMRAEALDAVLVHEYAHVQRRDDIAQFLQHAIAAMCALHPAVWWASRMLTIEREAACDDWAVLLATPPRTYASCLVALATGGVPDTAALQVGVVGGRSQLAGRVRRLIDTRRTRRLRPSWPTRTAVPVAVVLLAGGLTTAASRPGALPPQAETSARVETRRPGAFIAAAPPTTSEIRDASVRTAGSRRRTDHGLRRTAARPAGPGRLAVPDEGLPVRNVDADRPPAAPPQAPRDEVLPAGIPMVVSAVSAVSAVPSPGLPTVQAPRPGPSAPVQGREHGSFTAAGLAVADAGVSISRGAARGGVATGSFFTRLGKRVARTF